MDGALEKELQKQIAENLSTVKRKVSEAVKKNNRKTEEVCLIGVSKKKSQEFIRESYKNGLLNIGENYIQELLEKKSQLSDCKNLCWHFIGNLQRNKIKQIVGEVEYIHSVDRVELAQEISKVASQKNTQQKILVQVNLGGETTKGGVMPTEVLGFLSEISQLLHLDVVGLMGLPPLADEKTTRQFFKQLREIKNQAKLKELSMGTSADYEWAIEEGATMVRVGTSIFGSR